MDPLLIFQIPHSSQIKFFSQSSPFETLIAGNWGDFKILHTYSTGS